MLFVDDVAFSEGGNRPRNAQGPFATASRQGQSVDRLVEQAPGTGCHIPVTDTETLPSALDASQDGRA